MCLAVLNENEIRCLLQNLTLSELRAFQDALRVSLVEYSASTQAIDKADTGSANSVGVRSPEAGSTTVFIPLAYPFGHGVKSKSPLEESFNQSKLTRRSCHQRASG